MHYLRVSDGDGSETVEVPTEEDDTLLLSSLSNLYPGVSGLKYAVDGHTRIVKVNDGKLLPPPEGWGSHVYYCVYPKDLKRKAESDVDSGSKSFRGEGDSGDAKNSHWTYTDLVVLGLPWKTTDKELYDYFSKFGELQLAQVKLDPNGKSKGFGFIRFADSEVQVRVMLQRHQIDGRWCDVRIPLSKDGVLKKSPCKIFVGQCTDDMTEDILRGHFIKFGDISDVYVPKPFRGFAFVTFVDSEAVQSVCRQQHTINDKKVTVTEAIPKGVAKEPLYGYGGRSRGGYGGRGGRDDDDDYYGSRYSGRNYSSRKEWQDDPRYSSRWQAEKPWSRSSSSWQDKSGDDRNLNPDLVAKVVNKAVLGVIENLKGSPTPPPPSSDSGYSRSGGDTWWSRR